MPWGRCLDNLTGDHNAKQCFRKMYMKVEYKGERPGGRLLHFSQHLYEKRKDETSLPLLTERE